MALAFVQGTSGNLTASPGNLTAFVSSVTAGNLVLILCVDNNGSGTGFVTAASDNKGNTYQKVTGFEVYDSNVGCAMNLFWTKVTTGGTAFTPQVTFNAVSTSVTAVAQEFSGFTIGPALDKLAHAQASVTSNAPSSGATGTTTNANELVVGLGSYSGTAGTFTLGAGYTNLTQLNVTGRSAAMESKVVAATGTQTATFTLSATHFWGCSAVTYFDGTVASGSAVKQLAALGVG